MKLYFEEQEGYYEVNASYDFGFYSKPDHLIIYVHWYVENIELFLSAYMEKDLYNKPLHALVVNDCLKFETPKYRIRAVPIYRKKHKAHVLIEVIKATVIHYEN